MGPNFYLPLPEGQIEDLVLVPYSLLYPMPFAFELAPSELCDRRGCKEIDRSIITILCGFKKCHSVLLSRWYHLNHNTKVSFKTDAHISVHNGLRYTITCRPYATRSIVLLLLLNPSDTFSKTKMIPSTFTSTVYFLAQNTRS